MAIFHYCRNIASDPTDFDLHMPLEAEVTPVKEFHPEIDRVLRTVNCGRCRQHPDTVLSVRHLQSHHNQIHGWDLVKLLTRSSQEGEVPFVPLEPPLL